MTTTVEAQGPVDVTVSYTSPLPCPVCGHEAIVTFGPDIRFPGERITGWRAECGADDLCAAPTYTRFTREEAAKCWNRYVTETTANV